MGNFSSLEEQSDNAEFIESEFKRVKLDDNRNYIVWNDASISDCSWSQWSIAPDYTIVHEFIVSHINCNMPWTLINQSPSQLITIITSMVSLYPPTHEWMTQWKVLDELLHMNLPHTSRIKLAHLGILYALDLKMNGKFYLKNLLSFVDVYIERVQVYRGDDVEVKENKWLQLYAFTIWPSSSLLPLNNDVLLHFRHNFKDF